MAHDARIGLVAPLVGVGQIDAKALQEALARSTSTDGWLIARFSIAILAFAASAPSAAAAHWPIRRPA
jgi:hypothetical protein